MNLQPEADMLEAIRQRLREALKAPVEIAQPGGPLGPDATLHARNHRFVMEMKGSNRLATIRQACAAARAHAGRAGADAIPLVAVPFMGPSGRKACEEANVGFVDAAGNVQVEAPGLFVHVEGRRAQGAVRGRPSSAFAPKSARVARLLLLDPGRWWRRADIASEAGLGKSFVSKITARLRDDGLLAENEAKQVRALNPVHLLEAWQDEYRFRRHGIVAGHVGARSGEELADRFATLARQRGLEYGFTGLAAAAKFAPFAGFRLVAAYVRRVPDDQLLGELGFHRGDKGANLWLVVPNDEGVFAGSKDIDGHVCVSPVQAYLDLQGMPERAKEAAAHLREACLTWR